VPRLLRRREVWLPTWWGWLLLLALLAVIATMLGAAAYPLLAPTQPARDARTLVVEGWLDPGELRQVAAIVSAGHYERVLTTGLPLEGWNVAPGWRDSATRAATYLAANGVTSVPVIAVPAPTTKLERTYSTASTVRRWAERSGVRLDAIDIVSAGVHTRRSWLVYRMALGPQTEVGSIAVRPSEYDGERWWTTSEGAKATMGEVLSLAWTKCCFWPGGG
jgi:hypothetical protein